MKEHQLPTIAAIHARLGELVEQGLGELPVQILIVPDSTLQAIARNAGQPDDSKPALMIDLVGEDGGTLTLAATERWGDDRPRPGIQ